MNKFNLAGKMTRKEALSHLKASILAETDTFADAEIAKATAAGETQNVEESKQDFTMKYIDEINNKIEALQAKLENNYTGDADVEACYQKHRKAGLDYMEAVKACASDLRMDPQAVHTILNGPMMEAEELDLDAEESPEGEDFNLNLDTPQGDTEIDVDSNGIDDMTTTSEDGSIYDDLAGAFKKAQGTGDQKLINQIANTITYFNKTHILKRG